jgi:hypothetical protein
MIEIVRSGGQTGVDRAAWDAALYRGLKTCGFMPRNFTAEDGYHPDFAVKYGAEEYPSSDYPSRTRANVAAADMTMVMGDVGSRGSILAFRTAAENFIPAFGWQENAPDRWVGVEFDCPESKQRKWKHFQVVRSMDEAADLIRCFGPRSLNVGGNRESRRRGVYDWAYRNLVELFRELQREV